MAKGYGPNESGDPHLLTAAEREAQATTLSFTADDGLLLAKLAGEAQANQRGNALRRGMRPVHTYGVIVKGEFTPSGEHLPAAPEHLIRGALPVVARFSSCDAHISRDDRRILPRGLGVRFCLRDGSSTDLVMMSTDRFPVTSREAFVAVSHALSSPPLKRLALLFVRWALRQFKSPLTFFTQFSPVSYARCDYYAIHTFVWTHGNRQDVRYRLRASAGRRRLWPWTRLFKSRDYLTKRLRESVHDHQVNFVLEVQLANGVPPARLRNVGKPLPGKIDWKPVGTLRLTQIVDDDDELDQLVFSPAHLTAGVEPYPGDEIFALRAAAYPASHVFRTMGVP